MTLARKSPVSSSCSHLARYDGPGSSVNAGPTLSQMPGPLLVGVAEILGLNPGCQSPLLL